MLNRLLIFGFGYVGKAFGRHMQARGCGVMATARAGGLNLIDPSDASALGKAAATADAILVTAPPDVRGCPGLIALAPVITARTRWIGYLSTTGVYGDRDGAWVFEDSALAAQSMEGARRVGAERDWLASGLPVCIFRLPGIYGPGRSPFERLRDGSARRLVKPGHVFSRIHLADICSGLEASVARPNPGRAYNLCDDEPASAAEVTAYAARLLGVEPPQEEPFASAALSAAARRFYDECKRVSNARAKAELGWRPAYPTYREGLAAILADAPSYG